MAESKPRVYDKNRESGHYASTKQILSYLCAGGTLTRNPSFDLRAGWCPAGAHNSGSMGSIPMPATDLAKQLQSAREEFMRRVGVASCWDEVGCTDKAIYERRFADWLLDVRMRKIEGMVAA